MRFFTNLKRFAHEMHYPVRPEIRVRKRAIRSASILDLPQRRSGFVEENVNFSGRLAEEACIGRRRRVLVSDRLKPMLGVFSSGSRVFRANSALLSLWLVFPLMLILTSDWIGLLVIFQALTAAVRLRALPAARAMAAFSPVEARSGRYEGECRAR
jgi:hypothetical protein